MGKSFDWSNYKYLVQFLGACLGKHTEVVLYNFQDISQSVIEICNQGVSGIKVGDPLSGFAVSVMKDKGKEGPPYYLNHKVVSENKRVLYSNSFLILDANKQPMGMISTHTNTEPLRETIEMLKSFMGGEDNRIDEVENIALSPVDLIKQTMDLITTEKDIDPERMTGKEKMAVVEQLNEDGFFLIKGAVSQTAKMIGLSEATVYRYLSKINKSREI